jgi:hypothetical protein
MAETDCSRNGEILVIRKALDAGLMREVAMECGSIIARSPYIVSTGQGSPSDFDIAYFSGRQAKEEYPAITRAAQHVVGDVVQNFGLQANRQGPRAYQHYHPDRAWPSAVIHASDGGAFDLIPEGIDLAGLDYYEITSDPSSPRMAYGPELENIETLEVNAGDILIQLKRVIHRGRNNSDNPRINLGIYPQ